MTADLADDKETFEDLLPEDISSSWGGSIFALLPLKPTVASNINSPIQEKKLHLPATTIRWATMCFAPRLPIILLTKTAPPKSRFACVAGKLPRSMKPNAQNVKFHSFNNRLNDIRRHHHDTDEKRYSLSKH